MRIPILSLFCGCGGLDLGFTQAGFEVVLALDVDSAAVRTYNLNHGEGIARVANLAELDGNAVIELLQAKSPPRPPRGVIGGPPCQAFSHSNVYVKRDHIQRTLPGRYAFILKTLNEQYDLDFFVFENVRGITFDRHRKEFARFRALFEDAGFRLFERLLNAVDFGVPQKRARVFVVGLNQDKFREWDFVFPEPHGNPVRTVADAISRLPEPRFFERGLMPEDIPHHPNHWTMRPKSRKFHDGSLKEGHSSGRSFRVLSWGKPSWAVAYGNREVHIHPSGKRRLSVYEAMLLQGFPKTYQLLGTLSHQIRQVSDAVPPPLARALARSITLFFQGDERTRIPRASLL